jgi:hypothetical protein
MGNLRPAGDDVAAVEIGSAIIALRIFAGLNLPRRWAPGLTDRKPGPAAAA